MIALKYILGLALDIINKLREFWKKMVNWIKKAAKKIEEVLGVVVEGTRTFIVRTQDGLENKSYYYNVNKLSGELEETVYTKKVQESEVPPEIKAKVNAQPIGVEVSTTEEFRGELRLALET